MHRHEQGSVLPYIDHELPNVETFETYSLFVTDTFVH
jgi:hypothetical protein